MLIEPFPVESVLTVICAVPVYSSSVETVTVETVLVVPVFVNPVCSVSAFHLERGECPPHSVRTFRFRKFHPSRTGGSHPVTANVPPPAFQCALAGYSVARYHT
jgi:hypothetical protein